MLVREKVFELANKDTLFLSRPIKCYCNNVVFCYKVSENDNWACPVCESIFPKSFQQPMSPHDAFDRQTGDQFGFEPDLLTGRWSVDDPEHLLVMVGPIRR